MWVVRGVGGKGGEDGDKRSDIYCTTDCTVSANKVGMI